MAKSKETFNKKEKEKKRQKQKQEKKEKMEMRKANAGKGKSLDDMMAYLDENGNLTSTPPDPKKKREFNVEDIQIGVPKMEEVEESPIRSGVVNYFNTSKGFGFINDSLSGERIFVHINQCENEIQEGDKVSFEVEKGDRGWNAKNVKTI